MNRPAVLESPVGKVGESCDSRMTQTSLIPRPKEEEEEEKGPGFSHSCMRLNISVDQWEGANDAFKVTRSVA